MVLNLREVSRRTLTVKIFFCDLIVIDNVINMMINFNTTNNKQIQIWCQVGRFFFTIRFSESIDGLKFT